jgi:hypothetical protein
MKTIITAITAILFTTGVNAADVYQGIDQGNPDLSAQRTISEGFVGVQPSIGDSANRYHGWAEGNPDLFAADSSGPTDSGNDPNIYHDFAGNPDLQF